MKKELLKLPLKEKEKLILTELDHKFNLEDSETLYKLLKDKPEIFGLVKNKWLKDWLEQTSPSIFSSRDFYTLVIFPLAHPAFQVEDIVYAKLKVFYWRYRIGPKRKLIEKVEKSVGRLIAVYSNGKKKPLGTCFKIAEDFVVTTRSNLNRMAVRLNLPNRIMVGFSNKKIIKPEQSFLVKKLIYASQKTEPDLAIFQLEKKNMLQAYLPKQLSLSHESTSGKLGLIIGYPFKISNRNRKLEHLAIFGSSWNLNKKRIAPGHMNSVTNSSFEFSHDCTTETGNEGSPIIELDSGKILGMHCYKTLDGQGIAIRAQYIDDILKHLLFTKPYNND